MDESSHEKLIEDYLLSAYRPVDYRSSFDADQQFAKPIEDEDIFGIDNPCKQPEARLDENSYTDSFGIENPYGIDSELDFDKSHIQNQHQDEDSIVLLTSCSPRKSRTFTDIDVDKIFEDGEDEIKDKIPQSETSHSKSERIETYSTKSDENANRSLAREAMLRKIREQALAKGLVAKKLGYDCAEGDVIEIDVKESDEPSSGRLIYTRLIEQATKRKQSTLTWAKYLESLRKKICADKRKVWDTFQNPTDNYDDEEELIGSAKVSPTGSHTGSPSGSRLNSPTQSNDNDPFAEDEDMQDESEGDYDESNDGDSDEDDNEGSDLNDNEDNNEEIPDVDAEQEDAESDY